MSHRRNRNRMKGRTNRMITHFFDQLLGAVNGFFGLLLIP